MFQRRNRLHSILCLTPFVVLSTLSGCKSSPSALPSEFETASKYASESNGDSGKVYLQLSKNEFCQVGSKNNTYFKNVLEEQKGNLNSAAQASLQSQFEILTQSKGSLELCNVDIEDWILKSIALGQPAPYDIAGLRIDDVIAGCKLFAVLTASHHPGIATGFAAASVGLEWWKGRQCEK